LQLLAENNGKMNMNECNHYTKEADPHRQQANQPSFLQAQT